MPSINFAIASIIPYALIILGLAITVITYSYISKNQKSLMLAVLTLSALLIFQNAADYLLNNSVSHIMLHTIMGILGYSIRPAIIVVFCSIISDDKRIIAPWFLVGANAALYLTALFSPITFEYSRTWGVFLRGPLGYTAHIVSAVLMLYLMVLMLKKFANNKRAMILPFISTFLIICAVLADTLLEASSSMPVSEITTAIVISCIFYFFWIHMQLVRKYEADLLTDQRIKIMISQIQPHFLYNTLATIRALCRKSPEKAAQVTEEFGRYLRQNMDSLNNAALIPVEEELEHTRLYADIEMVRFENIQVKFDIKDKGFLLPALTIQPIVENAIRHGVRIREKGLVSISTRFAYGFHEITVSDNGIGFDASKVKSGNGEHIGIENVRSRIEKMCGGTLDIKSEENKGTTVTIRLPVDD